MTFAPIALPFPQASDRMRRFYHAWQLRISLSMFIDRYRRVFLPCAIGLCILAFVLMRESGFSVTNPVLRGAVWIGLMLELAVSLGVIVVWMRSDKGRRR